MPVIRRKAQTHPQNELKGCFKFLPSAPQCSVETNDQKTSSHDGLHLQVCIGGDWWQSDLGRNKFAKLRRCKIPVNFAKHTSEKYTLEKSKYKSCWSYLTESARAACASKKKQAMSRCQTFHAGKATPALQSNYPPCCKCKRQIVDERRRGHQLSGSVKFEIIFLCGICHFTSGQISTY